MKSRYISSSGAWRKKLHSIDTWANFSCPSEAKICSAYKYISIYIYICTFNSTVTPSVFMCISIKMEQKVLASQCFIHCVTVRANIFPNVRLPRCWLYKCNYDRPRQMTQVYISATGGFRLEREIESKTNELGNERAGIS